MFEKNYRLQDIQLSNSASYPLPTFAGVASFGVATFARSRARRLVENTGLEPVTSWLQTRRSPS